jgi:glycosyltransferase involved in cell wall biosynthesis
MRVAIVTPRMASGERGGAEALYRGLLNAFREASHEADEIAVESDESSFDAVLESYARFYALDLRDYDLVVSTKAPTFMVSHPNHASYLLHTLRVFYDMFAHEYGEGTAEQRAQRQAIHALDRFGLRQGRIRRHFSNGHTTYRRLVEASPWWQEVGFAALHHPPALSGFKGSRRQDFILLPGRLHRWKRAHLIIDAYKHLKRDVPLLITGTGEDEAGLRKAAAGDRRIQFLGGVSEAELVDLYADALLVPFVPRQEDYGLVTIEAFKSSKPVLTCSDSGETLEFVRDGVNGYVVEPDARAIAARLTDAIDHRRAAASMGAAGQRSVSHIAWEPIVEALIGSPRRSPAAHMSMPAASRASTALAVTVLDMQPIDPPVGGGRLRLLGLYHALGADVRTTYVGTYDWPGMPHRRHALSETLEEIDVPLTPAHFAAAADWKRRAGGRTVIDVAFPHLAHHSPEYVQAARAHAASADVVVFSHPWVYPLVKDLLRQRPQLVVYDAQNVEGVLRLELLRDDPFGARLARHVAALERDLCRAADLVLTCSHEDRALMHDVYDIPFARMHVVPNGTFTVPVTPSGSARRAALKRDCQLPAGPAAVFVGTFYPPNVEAARFIVETLAPVRRGVTFVVCGGVGEAFAGESLPANVHLTGRLDEDAKRRYIEAADLAVNPMQSGSGTNIKMFDFMAAGLPIVTTEIGARGIRSRGQPSFLTASLGEFGVALDRVLDDSDLADQLGSSARAQAVEMYSWERVSPSLGRLLARRIETLARPQPKVSVVVASYERQEALGVLLERLARQTCREFEVIVVDQSRVPVAVDDVGLDLLLAHTDVPGAVNARNLGAFYARGDLLAFTDDDCRPDRDWIERALSYFEEPRVVGVEGIVLSDRAHDPRFRPVTNVGFEGIGFMTANLFLRRETFAAIDGFDGQFDHPHFREDTDLGWRALEHGAIPYAADVRVYHPPQPRSVAREGVAERLSFFEKDALLLKKHPERYRTLFLREGHFAHTEGFGEHLLRGAAKYGVELDEFYRSRCHGAAQPAAGETSHV